jgi:hypothetical protein
VGINLYDAIDAICGLEIERHVSMEGILETWPFIMAVVSGADGSEPNLVLAKVVYTIASCGLCHDNVPQERRIGKLDMFNE